MSVGLVVGVLAAVAGGAVARADEPPGIAWEKDALTVSRSQGDAVTLTVVRSGDVAPAITATVTGSEGFEGEVTVPPGSTSATIRVPLPGRGDIAPGGFVYFTLSDADGATIDQPGDIAITIYEDEPDPQPKPRRGAPPDTAIHRTRRNVIAGTASDRDRDVARVELSVLARSDGGCRRLRANGRLGRIGRCRTAYTLTAKGTTAWALHLERRLPPGRYVVRSRAVDAAGHADRSPARRTFSIPRRR
jgi:hypothetical protein